MKKLIRNAGLSLLLLCAFAVSTDLPFVNAASVNGQNAEQQKLTQKQLKHQKVAKQIESFLKQKQFNGAVLIAKDGILF